MELSTDLAAGLKQPPPELQALHDALYEKIKQMTAGQVMNPKQDPHILQVILETTMQMIEKLRKQDGTAYTGSEKKTMAIAIIKWVIGDLGKNGIIPEDIAAEVVLSVSILGGPAIDMIIAAGKGVYDFTKKVVEELEQPTNGQPRRMCCFGR